MTVTIKKGEQVIVPAYRDTVFIYANYTHGDGNGHSTETVFYPDRQTEDIHFDLEGLAFLRTVMTGQYAATTESAALAVRQHFEANAFFGLDEDAVDNFIEQFVIQDDHDDSYEYAATLKSVDVFAHDGLGVRHQMEVKVNGEALHD